MSSFDPYAVLRISEDATDNEVRAAYAKLRRRLATEGDHRERRELEDAFATIVREKDRSGLRVFGLSLRDELAGLLPEDGSGTRAGVGLWVDMLRAESSRRESPYPRRKS